MNDLIVLCYHGISATWPAETTVGPAELESQLAGFLARGYEAATLEEALTTPPAERTFVVTFDDAHRSVLEQAVPIMARLSVPGTVFVPTDYASSQQPMAWDGYDMWMGTEHERELDCMTWDELRGLDADGWEIGSHTCSHPRLSTLDEERIAAELTESRAVCEREMGKPCRSIAYPYSDYDDRVVRAAREAGYQFAVTVPRGSRAPLPLQWPRVGVYNGESAGRVRLRAGLRRFQQSPVARLASALRGGGS
jgi:peptidoglycan/xylan/chitin deacetylase (PgdA/CDA1 family)